MFNLQKSSLLHSLLLFSMLTSGVGLVLACTGFLFYDIHEFRAKKLQDLKSTADLLASNAYGAMAFNDTSASDETVQTMRMRPGIRDAVLYQSDGKLLAWYVRRDLTGKFEPPKIPPQGVKWTKDSLQLAQTVFMEDRPVGTLYLEDDLSDLHARMAHFGWSCAVMVVVCLVVVYLLSVRLRGQIARPIYDLAGVARLVASGKDYTLRAPEKGIRELAQLSADFNQMLTEIQRREGALTEARDSLEKRVTERTKELEAEKKLFQALSASAPIGIFMADREGQCLYVNQRWTEMTGFRSEEAMGYGWKSAVHEDDRERVLQEFQEAVRTNELFASSMRYVSRSGNILRVETVARALPSADGSAGTFIGAVLDVTERYKAAERIQEAKEAAEAANRAKSEFLANMSHEIRTPMNGILGMTELALDIATSPEQREYLGMAKYSAEALLEIINDILDFSKIEAGRLDLERVPFSLLDCIEDAVHPLAIKAQQKGLELTWFAEGDLTEQFEGDPTRLRQILINLAGNAIKFTKEGEVSVRAERLVSKDNDTEAKIRFTVSDTGIGIPLEKHQQIFEAFSQADTSTTREFGGTGLGLSISSRLVKLMRGEMDLESVPGKGSKFHFTARFGRLNSGKDAEKKTHASLEGKRVLVVDDNDVNRKLLASLLPQWGMQPVVVADGEDALAVYKQNAASSIPFHVVLLDQNMPKMDGYELVEQIRQLSPQKQEAILMLSSSSSTADQERAKKLGIARRLTKPIRRFVLRDAMLEALAANIAEVHTKLPKVEAAISSGIRILLVEDNRVNQELAMRLLKKMGHEVSLAVNGLEAVERVSRETFDLVLMDVQMPVLGGMDATKEIRKWEKLQGGHVPIVAMTAHAMTGDAEKCIEAGMDGYVSKPIRRETLASEIERATNSKKRTVITQT